MAARVAARRPDCQHTQWLEWRPKKCLMVPACIANTHTTCIKLALALNCFCRTFDVQAAHATVDSTIFQYHISHLLLHDSKPSYTLLSCCPSVRLAWCTSSNLPCQSVRGVFGKVKHHNHKREKKRVKNKTWSKNQNNSGNFQPSNMIESFIQPKYVTDSPPGGPDAGFAAGFAARSVSTASRKHIAAPWIRRKLGAQKFTSFCWIANHPRTFSRQHDTHCNVTPTVLKTFKKSSKRMMRSGIRRLLWQKINFHFGSAMQCCSYAIKVHIDIALHKSRLRDAICEEDTSSLTSFIT